MRYQGQKGVNRIESVLNKHCLHFIASQFLKENPVQTPWEFPFARAGFPWQSRRCRDHWLLLALLIPCVSHRGHGLIWSLVSVCSTWPVCLAWGAWGCWACCSCFRADLLLLIPSKALRARCSLPCLPWPVCYSPWQAGARGVPRCCHKAVAHLHQPVSQVGAACLQSPCSRSWALLLSPLSSR